MGYLKVRKSFSGWRLRGSRERKLLFCSFLVVLGVDNLSWTTHPSLWCTYTVLLTKVTMLYSRSLECIHIALLKLYTHRTAILHFPPSPQFLDTTHHSTFLCLTTLNTSCKWDHAVFILLWLAYFDWHNIPKVAYGMISFVKIHLCFFFINLLIVHGT